MGPHTQLQPCEQRAEQRGPGEVAETNLVDVIGLRLLVETVALLQLSEEERREEGRREKRRTEERGEEESRRKEERRKREAGEVRRMKERRRGEEERVRGNNKSTTELQRDRQSETGRQTD